LLEDSKPLQLSDMSLLNQISRQVTRQIDLQPSKLFPKGISLPPDIIEHIVFEYLLPHHWTVPRNLQQDICLLRDGSGGVTNGRALLGTYRKTDYGDIHGEWFMVSDEEYWAKAREEQGERFRDWAVQEQTRPEGPPVRTLTDSKHRFQMAWSFYQQSREKIMDKFVAQANWSKVKILNHMRSVENPVLGMRNSPPNRFRDYAGQSPDFMEVRELTDEDMVTAGVSPDRFDAVKQANRLSLETTFDEIIRNDQKMLLEDYGHVCGHGEPGKLNSLTWIPGINGSGGIISFGTRR
jgi:hypothetical protein